MRALFLIIICFFILSCEKKQKNYSDLIERTEETIDIAIEKKETNNFYCFQYFEQKDSNYLIVLNEYNSSIDFYNLESKKRVKVYKIQREGENAFPFPITFLCKTIDTVVLISLIPQVVGIMDGSGKIIKKISYEKDKNNKILVPSFSIGGSKPFLQGNILNLIQQHRINEPSGILNEVTRNKMNVAISVNISNGIVSQLPLVYPPDLVDVDISNMLIIREIGYKNQILYHFDILDKLYITKDFKIFSKINIGTEQKLNLPGNQNRYMNDLMSGLKYIYQKDQVFNIFYDKYRKYHYIIVRKGGKIDNENVDYSKKLVYPNCFIIILDQNFRFLGETFFPLDVYAFNKVFINAKGMYISEDNIDNPSYTEDSIKFRLFKINKL